MIVNTIQSKGQYRVVRILLFFVTVLCMVTFIGTLAYAMRDRWDIATFNLVALYATRKDWIILNNQVRGYKMFLEYQKQSNEGKND